MYRNVFLVVFSPLSFYRCDTRRCRECDELDAALIIRLKKSCFGQRLGIIVITQLATKILVPDTGCSTTVNPERRIFDRGT
jgi:hypothetical protein